MTGRAKHLKLTLLVPCALLPMVAFASLAASAALESYQRLDEQGLRNMAQALAAATDARLQSYVTALEVLAESPFLNGDAGVFETHARGVAERLGGRITVLEPAQNHATPIRTGARAQDSDLPDAIPRDVHRAIAAPLARVVHGAPYAVSDLFVDPATGQQAFATLVPVDRAGQPRWALMLMVDPRSLNGILASQRLPNGVIAALGDGRQRVVAYSLDPTGQAVGTSAPSWMTSILSTQRAVTVAGPGWSGQSRIFTIEPLHNTDWRVAAAETLDAQACSAWRSIRWLLAGGGTLLAALGLSIWVTRHEELRSALREGRALRAGRAEVERLHAGLPAVVFLRDVARDGSVRLVYCGGDIEAVTGWPAAAPMASDGLHPWVDLKPHEYNVAIDGVMRSGTGTVEYRIRQPDGSARWLRSHMRRLSTRPGGGGEIVSYILDVTSERAADARSLSATQLAALGEMAAALTHELRQPVATILGAVENAREDKRDLCAAHVDQRLELIGRQAARALAVIERLRRFARGAGERVDPEKLRLSSVVDRALSLSNRNLAEAGIRVEISLGHPATVVRADGVLLEQVLLNLLNNAVDALAAQRGRSERHITIGGERAGGSVCLTIADTGGGIAPRVLDRIFEPFVTTKDPGQGTGLGLWICHTLLSAMGGTITGSNTPAGASFSITLPAGCHCYGNCPSGAELVGCGCEDNTQQLGAPDGQP